jgi:hypothetical protein
LQLFVCPKFKEEQKMSFAKSKEAKRAEIEDLARHWGELLAREVYPNGAGMDVSLADMEEMVACATSAIVQGAIGKMTEDQAQLLEEHQPCPTCGKTCQVRRKSRTIAVRGGSAELAEPVAHCPKCRRDFFPSACGSQD